jgi:hypothetical protein
MINNNIDREKELDKREKELNKREKELDDCYKYLVEKGKEIEDKIMELKEINFENCIFQNNIEKFKIEFNNILLYNLIFSYISINSKNNNDNETPRKSFNKKKIKK